MDLNSSESPSNPDHCLNLPPFPVQHYPPELSPSRWHGVINFFLLLLLLPPVSALGGMCGQLLCAGEAPLMWDNLAGPALLGAVFGTVNGLFARAHTKLNLIELLFVALVAGAVPQILIAIYVYMLSFLRFNLGP